MFQTEDGKKHNVKDASPEIFDAWVRDYVEEIQGVDTAVWQIFHRWNIINDLLKGEFLDLVQYEDGYLLGPPLDLTSDHTSEIVAEGSLKGSAEEHPFPAPHEETTEEEMDREAAALAAAWPDEDDE